MTAKAALKTWRNGNFSDVTAHLRDLTNRGKFGIAERFVNELYKKMDSKDRVILFKMILGMFLDTKESTDNHIVYK